MAESALQFLRSFFRRFRLEESLADWAWQRVKEGLSIETVLLEAQDRHEWKQRFIGNEHRRSRGLRVLEPDEYLRVEEGYASVLRVGGVPNHLWNSTQKMGSLIGNNVSVQELGRRVDIAVSQYNSVPTEVRDALARVYGITRSEAIGFVLDPHGSIEQMERRFRAAEVAGAASVAEIDTTRSQAERIASFGFGFSEALEGFQQVRSVDIAQRRASFAVGSVDQSVISEAIFTGDAESIERLSERERQARSLSETSQGTFGTTGEGILGLTRRR